MQAAADSLAFAPPPEPAAIRGFVLAVIAHLLLLIALSGLITWQSDDRNNVVEAELWSSLPRQAAPAAAPPAPPPQSEVQQQAAQPAPPPVAKQPDIAVEREKKRREDEAKRREQEELQRKQLEAQKRKLQEQRKVAQEKSEREASLREQARQDQLARMQALASGGGPPNSQGSAAKSAGPSDSYAGRIRARVKPNIVFTDDVPGNPSAEVEVRVAPDGTIVSRKITKPSGVKSWDEAVLRALDKTEVLPRDVDGRVHTPLIIEFRLRG